MSKINFLRTRCQYIKAQMVMYPFGQFVVINFLLTIRTTIFVIHMYLQDQN